MSDLQKKLQELIHNSESINNLFDNERNTLVSRMLAAPPDKMEEIIKALEEEKEEIQKRDAEITALEQNMKAVTNEMVEVEHEVKRYKRKAAEDEAKKKDEMIADQLLEKLEEIV
ncbi:hypothetical protein JW911_04025 [Candidatus Peregrinibacteria bacterium]|nr:hypothetical protein [Candidatus Peregrinibacteria bacterium]